MKTIFLMSLLVVGLFALTAPDADAGPCSCGCIKTGGCCVRTPNCLSCPCIRPFRPLAWRCGCTARCLQIRGRCGPRCTPCGLPGY